MHQIHQMHLIHQIHQIHQISQTSNQSNPPSFMIPDCIKYNKNISCLACLAGFCLNADNMSCVAIENLSDAEYNKTINSQIVLSLPQNSQNAYINNQQNQELMINITIPNYNVCLAEDTVTFQSTTNKSKTKNVRISKSGMATSMGSLNLTNVSSDTYTMKMKFNVNKVKRILQVDTSSLPDSFLLTYETREKYFIGTEAEIQKKIESDSANKGNTSNSEFNSELFAILFSTLAFACLFSVVGVVFVLRRKKDIYKSVRLPEVDLASPTTTPIKVNSKEKITIKNQSNNDDKVFEKISMN